MCHEIAASLAICQAARMVVCEGQFFAIVFQSGVCARRKKLLCQVQFPSRGQVLIDPDSSTDMFEKMGLFWKSQPNWVHHDWIIPKFCKF